MWLIGKVDEDFKSQKYGALLDFLFEYEYVWYDELDENWAGHCVALRERFYDESIAGRRYARIYGDMKMTCNVLEMLVALSIQIEEKVMTNDYYGDRTCRWFWTMLGNLELLINDDKHYDEIDVIRKVQDFLEKEYFKDGTCGPFRLENTAKFVVKNASFWKQAMIYMSQVAEENGEI